MLLNNSTFAVKLSVGLVSPENLIVSAPVLVGEARRSGKKNGGQS